MITTHLMNNIACFHDTSTDFLTGSNPPYHRHENTYEIYLYIRGNTTIYVEQHCYNLSPGDLFLIHPNELHRSIIVDDTPYERIGINISPKTIMALSSDNTPLMNCFSTETNKGSRIIHLSSYNLNKYINLTDDFLRYSHSDEYGCDLLAITTIINLLLFTNQLFHNSNHIEYKNIMPKLVINIMKYIANHLTDVITLENISRELHYSTNYISTQFKHHTGLTLRAYILDKRIENAKKLLLLGKNVSETCVLSGFNDYANFIRSFTKKTGISPGHYKAFIENLEK